MHIDIIRGTLIALSMILGGLMPTAVSAQQEQQRDAAGQKHWGRLPRWLELGAELRGRAEGSTGLGYVRGANDARCA